MVGASGRKRVQLTTDWGIDGGHLFFDNDAVLTPHDSHELAACLVRQQPSRRFGNLREGEKCKAGYR